MRNNIEAERGRLGISKEELARRLGITSKTYNNYIRGGPIPSPILEKMALLFNCTLEYLLDIQMNFSV